MKQMKGFRSIHIWLAKLNLLTQMLQVQISDFTPHVGLAGFFGSHQITRRSQVEACKSRESLAYRLGLQVETRTGRDSKITQGSFASRRLQIANYAGQVRKSEVADRGQLIMRVSRRFPRFAGPDSHRLELANHARQVRKSEVAIRKSRGSGQQVGAR